MEITSSVSGGGFGAWTLLPVLKREGMFDPRWFVKLTFGKNPRMNVISDDDVLLRNPKQTGNDKKEPEVQPLNASLVPLISVNLG